MESLDNILSRDGNAMPSTEPTQNEVATQPAQSQQPAPEATTDNDEPEAVDVGGQRMVPQQALHAQREKVKRYTEQVAEFDRKLSETNAQWERRMAEIMQRLPQQQPQQQPEPDWFEQPAEAARQAVAPQFDQIHHQLMHNAMLVAQTIHTPEAVSEAEKAFMQAVQSRQLDPADYQRVVNSPNRYAAAVDWHKRTQTLAEIGPDPVAYREKIKAEERAAIMAEYGIQPNQQPGQAPRTAQVMPSSFATARSVGARSGPAWGGPSTISDILGSVGKR